MKKHHLALFFVSGLAGWGLLMVLTGVVPLKALWFLAAVTLAVVAIAALVAFGISGRWLALLLLMLPGLARAQSVTEFGSADDAQVAAVTDLANKVWFAIANREWWMVASLIVTGLTWAWRFQLVDRLWKDSAVDRFFDHPKVAALTPAVLATLGGLASGFAGTGPFAVDVLIANVVKVWAGSVAGYVVVKKLTEKPAPVAGEVTP